MAHSRPMSDFRKVGSRHWGDGECAREGGRYPYLMKIAEKCLVGVGLAAGRCWSSARFSWLSRRNRTQPRQGARNQK